MNDVIENIFLNDNTISGPKLQAVVMASTGATLSLRSIQRAEQKLVDDKRCAAGVPYVEAPPVLT